MQGEGITSCLFSDGVIFLIQINAYEFKKERGNAFVRNQSLDRIMQFLYFWGPKTIQPNVTVISWGINVVKYLHILHEQIC